MRFNSSGDDKMQWRFMKRAMVALVLIPICYISDVASSNIPRPQTEAAHSCGGLHAGIRAELVRKDPNYSRPAFVMISFILLNDGETPGNSTSGGWKLVIDGQEVSDSNWVFGNGPQPEGGYGILRPGESYQFGKELEISRYFSKLGEHTLSWRGRGFQSSTIRVDITAQ